MTPPRLRFKELLTAARQASPPALDVTPCVMESIAAQKRISASDQPLVFAATLSITAAVIVGAIVWWCDRLVTDPLLEFVVPLLGVGL